jgi:hypothetical protein
MTSAALAFFSAFLGWARSHGKSLKTASCMWMFLSLSRVDCCSQALWLSCPLLQLDYMLSAGGFQCFLRFLFFNNEEENPLGPLLILEIWLSVYLILVHTVYTSRLPFYLALVTRGAPCLLKDNTTIASLRERRIPPVQIINDDIELPSRPNQAIVWHSKTDSLSSLSPCIINHQCRVLDLYFHMQSISSTPQKEIYENIKQPSAHFIISYAFLRRNIYFFIQ